MKTMKTEKTKQQRQRGAISLLALFALVVIAVGFVAGQKLVQNTLNTRSFADTEFIHLIPNRDIQSELEDPIRSRTWDYILGGNLCFTSNPPSANGKFRVELSMRLKDKNNPANIVEEIIGASVSKLVTHPATLRCNSANLRSATFNAPFNIPEKERWLEECPEISVKVTTEGNWRPLPQQEIATIDRSLLCPNGVPTPITQPTAQPTTQQPGAPTQVPPTAQPSIAPTLTLTPTPPPVYITGPITLLTSL